MHAVISVLLQMALGLWIAAGFVDWLCHRRSGIERTSGAAESLCHWLLLAQMGSAAALAAVFVPSALLLALLLGLWLGHQATTYLELRWVAPIRTITPVEQMTHSLMEVLPLTCLMLLGISELESWLQYGALNWTLQGRAWQDVPWERLQAWAAIALAGLLFNGLPYLEEMWRCLRCPALRQRRSESRD